jgi:nucleoside-diphosphate-sugar epimerase
MIVGNGIIGNRFRFDFNDDDYLIFASGVSDSTEENLNEFYREENLLLDMIDKYPNLKLIYFSSMLCDVNDNKYYNHKLNMESLIIKKSKRFLIFRLPQVIGNNGNVKNIFNFFINSIKNDELLKLKINTQRSLIDIDDIFKIVIYCIDKSNQIINISHIEKVYVDYLVKTISESLNKSAKIEYIDGEPLMYFKNSPIVDEYISYIDKTDYTKKIIEKYI